MTPCNYGIYIYVYHEVYIMSKIFYRPSISILDSRTLFLNFPKYITFEGEIMKQITFNMVDSNHNQLMKVKEIVEQTGNRVTTTDIINIALKEFFNTATNTNNDLSDEENIAEVMKCYLVI